MGRITVVGLSRKGVGSGMNREGQETVDNEGWLYEGCITCRLQIWSAAKRAGASVAGCLDGPTGEGIAVVTPLVWARWEELLEDHPDKWWGGFLVRGIKEGFKVGFSGGLDSLKSSVRNMRSAGEQPQVVKDYLDKEVASGRLWEVGSVEAAAMGVHCSPFGVIPKRGKPGKWRLIVDLSSPEGHSVNDGIPKELCSLGYMSVDDVVAQVLKLGKGSELAKVDVQQAYRNVPVHPGDRHLLGMEWQGRVFIDGALPFGLRSAPLLFTALGDAIQWSAEKEGVSWMGHYIDDFVTVGRPDSGECGRNLWKIKEVCARVGMSLEPDKEVGPATAITFLGMELDSANMEVRLPEAKLAELRATLKSWRGMKSCRKRDLLSIIGVLSHACKAIRAGIDRLVNHGEEAGQEGTPEYLGEVRY